MTSTIVGEDLRDDESGIEEPGPGVHGEQNSAGLFDGDTGDAPSDARTVITYLVKNRILTGRDEPELWDLLLVHEQVVVRHFHNMFVDLSINRVLRVAYKQQLEPAGVPHNKVVRAVPMSLEASVLALYARERITMAVPGETVVIKRADARAQMEPYWPAQVHNKAAKDKKLNAALEGLANQDLLVRVGDDKWEVSPAISLVLTAQAIARFTDLLTAPEATQGPALSAVPDGPEDDDRDEAAGEGGDLREDEDEDEGDGS